MKKSILILALLLGNYLSATAQTFKLKTPSGVETAVTENTSVSAVTLPTIMLSVAGGKPPYIVKHEETVIGNITANDQELTLSAANISGFEDFLGRTITITKDDNSFSKTFTIIPAENQQPGTDSGEMVDNRNPPPRIRTDGNQISSAGFLSRLFPTSVREGTNLGIVLKEGARNSAYTGKVYTHVFYDFMGNLIFSTVPQGIANRSYVIHVVYPLEVSDIGKISYSIDQTGGSFSSDLYFRNSEAINDFALQAGVAVTWAHQEFLLGTATNDLSYELVRREVKKDGTIKRFVVTQATLNMSPVYHGSFDIGLLNTNLENPSFNLVQSPSNSDITVLKQTETGNRGIVTAMAILYTSPIVLLRNWRYLVGIDKTPQSAPYKLSGRSFLDDHTLFERIYPAVGVGISKNALENIFYGINWEIARGGSLFLGWHYGKVNTFSPGEEFVYMETPITEAEFNLYKNTEWKTNFAVGINLDIMIITNLLNPGSTR